MRYNVLSPDGFSIRYNKTYSTRDEAIQDAELWAKGYEKQGYYSSTQNGRIDLRDLPFYLTVVELKDLTKQDYQDYLNDVGTPEDDKKSNGGRIPDHAEYGRWLRRNDPIAFNVGYNDFK